jgi:hypothetical protein
MARRVLTVMGGGYWLRSERRARLAYAAGEKEERDKRESGKG